MSCSLLGTYCAQELTGIRGGGQSSLQRQLEARSEDRSCGAGSRPRPPRAPWVSGGRDACRQRGGTALGWGTLGRGFWKNQAHSWNPEV